MQNTPHQIKRLRSFLAVSAALFGLVIAFCLIPPVFTSLFVMGPLINQEVLGLWGLSAAVVILSGFCFLLHKKAVEKYALLFVSVLLLISMDLSTRLYIVLFKPQSKIHMTRLANRTYPAFMAYQGHPFLQFTGNPSRNLIGNQNLGALTSFNNFGFIGDDFSYEKPNKVVRVAALGGSTTASGYPKILQTYLNENNPDSTYSFEVLNFGLGWYTSTHSLVNFVTNVTDFSPDYVIIHHAWNDNIARNTPDQFRTDYSHALQYFHEPEIIDKYFIRLSVLYRYVKNKLAQEPDWAFLENVLEKRGRPLTAENWRNMDELKPYERNITTILDLAQLRGIKVILTTQPFSTDSNKSYVEVAPHIEQCNTLMRRIHESYYREALFVDLDEMMTGKMEEVFRDVAHIGYAGRQFKAEQIGLVILDDREE